MSSRTIVLTVDCRVVILDPMVLLILYMASGRTDQLTPILLGRRVRNVLKRLDRVSPFRVAYLSDVHGRGEARPRSLQLFGNGGGLGGIWLVVSAMVSVRNCH